METREEEVRKLLATRTTAKGGITRNINAVQRLLACNSRVKLIREHVDTIVELRNKATKYCDRLVELEPGRVNDVDAWLNDEYTRVQDILVVAERYCAEASDSTSTTVESLHSGDDVKSSKPRGKTTNVDVTNADVGMAATAHLNETEVPTGNHGNESMRLRVVRETPVRHYENDPNLRQRRKVVSGVPCGDDGRSEVVKVERVKSWIDNLPQTQVGGDFHLPRQSQYPNVMSTPAQLPMQQCFFGKSLPKLSLPTYDGDPLRWIDWMGMFHAMVHLSPMSDAEKMTHLQSSVTGRAKSEISGFGYSGVMYSVALNALQERFGKRQLVVKAHLEKLSKLPVVLDGQKSSVQNLASTVQAVVLTLENLGYEGDLDAVNNCEIVVNKMSEAMRFRWARYLVKTHIDQPSLRTLNAWLRDEIRTYEWLPSKLGHQKSSGQRTQHAAATGQTLQAATSLSTDVSKAKRVIQCPIDDCAHDLADCPEFKNMDISKRVEVVQNHKRCFVCLRRGHWVRQCRSKRCGVDGCKRNHHALLHTEPVFEVDNSRSPNLEHSGAAHKAKGCRVLLQVLPVTLHGPAGTSDIVAMLDTGSTCSILCEDVAKKLGLQGERQQLELSGIRERSLLASSKVELGISSFGDIGQKQIHTVKGVWVVDRLNLPEVKVDMSKEKMKWSHLKDVCFPSMMNKRVTLLLGSDTFDLIKPIEIRSGSAGAPHGVNTKLGWTAVGPVLGMSNSMVEQVCHVHAPEHPDDELGKLVKKWWLTESFGCLHNIENPRSVEDKKAIEILESTTRKVDGRYETGLLWKDDDIVLPHNYDMAKNRLFSLERKLNREPALKAAYTRTIENDLLKGYARKLSPPETQTTVDREWFLPHHAVRNPNKPGKVRRVFDAAAKCQGLSLNDCLLTGPNLLKPLVGVLMRFREEPIALSSDIEGMYSQVRVPDRDQSVLRFLWREDCNKPPDIYQYQRHIFGATSSPTSAIYALHRAATDNRELFPEAARVVLDNFYMDDCLVSVGGIQKAVELQRDLVVLLSYGGFHLTKWQSNSTEVLREIPADELAPAQKAFVNGSIEMQTDRPIQRVLGMNWDTANDAFVFDLKSRDTVPSTPRQILSITSSIFDPLGLLAPVTLFPKLVMQELWRQKLKWDDDVTEIDREAFGDWLENLAMLKSLQVPRFYRDTNLQHVSTQLHIFVDASEKAFSASAYYRFIYPDNRVSCSFVMGKTRVAPIKPLTIPKLELQSAVLGTRLAQVILKETSYDIAATHFWSDSTTVIQWLKDTKGRHPTFIASRIAEILDSTSPTQWHHVPGRINVADDGSRGLSAAQFTDKCRWLNGPAFLLLPEDMWPEQPACKASAETSDWSGHVENRDAYESTHFIDVGRFSSWEKLWRTTALVLRFVHNIRQRKSDRKVGSLSVSEKEKAEMVLIQMSQKEYFEKELRALKSKKSVSRQSSLCKLAPFLDTDGVLRSRGRIGKCEAPYTVKYPIILSPKSQVTKLVIMHYHRANHHEGMEHLRHSLRQRFWILKARSVIRKVVHTCMFCRKRNAQSKPPLMGDLPEVRVRGGKPPFFSTGIDYFGPILVRKMRKTEKRYGCLFVCLATKSIHIEVAHSLETDSFLMALRRFISRRGNPRVIFSDNGTNFVGGERELRESIERWNQHAINDAMLQQNVEWHFNPPGAPHFGGLWERLVRSVKRAMKAVIQNNNTVLTDEVLATVTTEVESLLNSRPITPVSDDINDLEALTPNHFLLGRPSPNLPPDLFYDSDISSRRRWRQSQIIVEHLWKRWNREYMRMLMERQKWHQNQRSLGVGDLVLVMDPNQPRGNWSLGRVMKAYPGEDNVVRVVDVKTRFGLFKRPVTKLALLSD